MVLLESVTVGKVHTNSWLSTRSLPYYKHEQTNIPIRLDTHLQRCIQRLWLLHCTVWCRACTTACAYEQWRLPIPYDTRGTVHYRLTFSPFSAILTKYTVSETSLALTKHTMLSNPLNKAFVVIRSSSFIDYIIVNPWCGSVSYTHLTLPTILRV